MPVPMAWAGPSRCFNQDMVDLVATRDQLSQYRVELLLHGTTNTAVRELVDPGSELPSDGADGSSAQPSIGQLRSNSASTSSSPNSLTITAMRLPAACFNTLDNSVVLPLPRKPVTTVAGIYSQ